MESKDKLFGTAKSGVTLQVNRGILALFTSVDHMLRIPDTTYLCFLHSMQRNVYIVAVSMRSWISVLGSYVSSRFASGRKRVSCVDLVASLLIMPSTAES